MSDGSIASSSALMVVNVINLSVNGSIEADGNKVIGAQLGDIEIIDAREKSNYKKYVKNTSDSILSYACL